MGTTEKRGAREVALGFFLLCHPIPVLFHTVAVTMLALLAVWPAIAWTTVAFVIVAHMAMQCSIAVLNDYCDRRVDAVSKRDKPLVRGLVTPREALIFGMLLIALMVVLLLPLNPLALVVSLLYLLLGLAYNLGLKATPLSGIVFALAIPLIPVYAFVGVGHIVPFVFWLVPVAALLGIALNLANSLPDSEQDAAQGVRTLAVVLGMRRTLIVCPLLMLLAALVVATLMATRVVVTQLWISLLTLCIVCVIVGVLYLRVGPAMTVGERKSYFYLVVAGCLVLAGGWLISIIS